MTISQIQFAYKKKRFGFRQEFRDVHNVLQEISMEIAPGQLFGLVGPNGSGKTTLTKLILGVYEPDNGQILFEGRKRPSMSSSMWKEQIGWISGASTRLFSTINLNEHRAIYSSLYSSFDLDWFTNQLQAFGLANKLNKKPTEISFGERIKFELALTLAYRPRILILDEPTVGLDPMAIKQVRDLINEYVKEYRACGILTSHNLKDITETCHHGGFLKNGVVDQLFQSDEVDPESLEDRYREVFGSA